MRHTALIVAAALLGLLPPSPATAAEGLDDAAMLGFVVQCISSGPDGRAVFPTALDPRCPAPGPQESSSPVRWRKHDWGQVGPDGQAPVMGHQASDSVLDRTHGRPVVVQTFDFGDETRRFARFDRGNGDGGDLLTAIDGAVYGFFTEDGGEGEQWFVSSQCRQDRDGPGRMKAWLFFGADVRPGHWTERLVRLNITRSPDECPVEFNDAYTRYKRDTIDVPFRNVVEWRAGPTETRPIDTIVSEHYNGRTIAGADHLERFFFGQGVGKYRWERWEQLSRTSLQGAAERARGFANSGRCMPLKDSERPAAGWVMVDCRTWTSLVKLDKDWQVDLWGWPGRLIDHVP